MRLAGNGIGKGIVMIQIFIDGSMQVEFLGKVFFAIGLILGAVSGGVFLSRKKFRGKSAVIASSAAACVVLLLAATAIGEITKGDQSSQLTPADQLSRSYDDISLNDVQRSLVNAACKDGKVSIDIGGSKGTICTDDEPLSIGYVFTKKAGFLDSFFDASYEVFVMTDHYVTYSNETKIYAKLLVRAEDGKLLPISESCGIKETIAEYEKALQEAESEDGQAGAAGGVDAS